MYNVLVQYALSRTNALVFCNEMDSIKSYEEYCANYRS